MSLFCPKCGTQNGFINGAKPNFCTNCGYNFKSMTAFGASAKGYSQENHERGDGDGDEDYSEAGFSAEDIKFDTSGMDRTIKPKGREMGGNGGFSGRRHTKGSRSGRSFEDNVSSFFKEGKALKPGAVTEVGGDGA